MHQSSSLLYSALILLHALCFSSIFYIDMFTDEQLPFAGVIYLFVSMFNTLLIQAPSNKPSNCMASAMASASDLQPALTNRCLTEEDVMTMCQLEAERLRSRMDHLAAQNNTLRVALAESKVCDGDEMGAVPACWWRWR